MPNDVHVFGPSRLICFSRSVYTHKTNYCTGRLGALASHCQMAVCVCHSHRAVPTTSYRSTLVEYMRTVCQYPGFLAYSHTQIIYIYTVLILWWQTLWMLIRWELCYEGSRCMYMLRPSCCLVDTGSMLKCMHWWRGTMIYGILYHSLLCGGLY